MKKILMVLLAGIISISILLPGCGEAEPEGKPTIKLSDLNWGSAHFQSEMAKIIIEEGYGYPVELIEGGTIAVFTGVRTGDVDVMLEGWLPGQQAMYDTAMAAGDIELLGILNNDNWQSMFVVPTYVIKGDPERGIEPMAPDLKSVFDLDQPQYKELFKNPENPGKGLLVNCVPGWICEILNAIVLEAYGLDDDYDMINPGSQAGMEASLQGAYNKGEPWLGYYWGPTWISGMLDLTVLEEPEYDPEVFAKMQAASEDESLRPLDEACAYPSSDLFIAGHTGFSDKYPELAEMFGKWKLDTATLGVGLAYMRETGGEPIEASIWFLKNREDVWTKFVPADVANRVKAAVAEM